MVIQNEKATDQFVRDMLRDIGINRPWEQNGGPGWKKSALKGGSKAKDSDHEGNPEFTCVINKFIIIIEDKRKLQDLRFVEDSTVVTEYPQRNQYALNGAVHYAKTMLKNGIPYDKGIFAIGVAGGEKSHEIAVSYVFQDSVKLLDNLDNLDVFAEDKINEYYNVQVLGHRPRAETKLDNVKKVASKIHEGMRNYASVENNRKAPLVSAILLALRNPDFEIGSLKGRYISGKSTGSDGRKIYDAAKEYMEEEGYIPHQKIGTLLDQFSFIRNAPQLNRINLDLGMSPIKWLTNILNKEILEVVTDPSLISFDILGNFYHEFISYGGGDSNSLGIVLTPEHITTLMVEMIDISSSDYVLDPAAGTASFLIAAMQKMFNEAGDNPAVKEDIRENRLHGIELQDKLFAIGTTNMILRGDGKANFRRDSIFDAPIHEMRGDIRLDDGSYALGKGFTKVLLNPPYSQAKTKETRHLSELSFIERSLDFLNTGGRLAVIVPQSSMVGKTKEDRDRKKRILKNHSLDAVVTMNPATFVDSGSTPRTVIALFTAGRPHKPDAKVKFINFEKDGYKVAQHRGLVDDGTASSRRKHLLEVLRGDADAATNFLVRSEVTAEDEWQHSYFYFNDQPPTYEEFYNTVADYVSWQVDMYAHGFGNLITPQVINTENEE